MKDNNETTGVLFDSECKDTDTSTLNTNMQHTVQNKSPRNKVRRKFLKFTFPIIFVFLVLSFLFMLRINNSPQNNNSHYVQTSIAAEEKIVHITASGSKYHSAGCQYLSQSDIEISLEKAKDRGYTRCSKCRPPR